MFCSFMLENLPSLEALLGEFQARRIAHYILSCLAWKPLLTLRG